jgi:hypothetical protein
MKATVQEMHQNEIKTRCDTIVEAHKIVDMSMYIKTFVAKEFPYLLENYKMNDVVDVDDENEMQLSD